MWCLPLYLDGALSGLLGSGMWRGGSDIFGVVGSGVHCLCVDWPRLMRSSANESDSLSDSSGIVQFLPFQLSAFLFLDPSS